MCVVTFIPGVVISDDVVGDVGAQDVVHQERVRLHVREFLELPQQHLGQSDQTKPNQTKEKNAQRTNGHKRKEWGRAVPSSSHWSAI